MLMLVFRYSQVRRPEFQLARTKIFQIVICQFFCRCQRLLVSGLFIGSQKSMEHKIEFVSIHTAHRTFGSAEAFGSGAHISTLFLRVDDTLQYCLHFLLQLLIATLDGRQIGRLHPFPMLFCLGPIPCGVLAVYNKVYIRINGEIFQVLPVHLHAFSKKARDSFHSRNGYRFFQ